MNMKNNFLMLFWSLLLIILLVPKIAFSQITQSPKTIHLEAPTTIISNGDTLKCFSLPQYDYLYGELHIKLHSDTTIQMLRSYIEKLEGRNITLEITKTTLENSLETSKSIANECDSRYSNLQTKYNEQNTKYNSLVAKNKSMKKTVRWLIIGGTILIATTIISK